MKGQHHDIDIFPGPPRRVASITQESGLNRARLGYRCRTQLGDVLESQAFELKDGRAAYMMQVRITNQTAKAIYPLEMDLQLPWEEQGVNWLEPLPVPVKRRCKPDTAYNCYRFPGGLELQFDEVLNHLVSKHKKLIPKRPTEGWLLATGGLMPNHLMHGQELTAVLTITGSDHMEYSEVVTLWVDRLVAQASRAKQKAVALCRLNGAAGITKSAWIEPGQSDVSLDSSLYK